MKNHRYLKSTCVLLLCSALSWGQGGATPNPGDFSKIADVLPPSPNAASLGKFGGIEPGLVTGTANINVPIYEYSSINLKLPLSLSYSSNGFRVDELSGRVGTGWSLNAGGVVTRTVYGAADEHAERLATPIGFPTRNLAFLEFMEALASSNGYGPQDAQPDMFSFNVNGISGRFILDGSGNPVVLSHSNLKIETDFQVTAAWNIKVTSADGVQYLFGGENATERTKKISAGPGCGKSYTNFIPTAWYLKTIVHPFNDQIEFTYSSVFSQYATGISETIYETDGIGQHIFCYGFSITPPVMNNSICESILQTQGVLLEEVSSTGGGKLKLIYSNRSDGDDKLLTAIEAYQPGQTGEFRIFEFNYATATATNFMNSFSTLETELKYRYFLTAYIEKSTDGLLSKKYFFTYNDINGLPPRLSFAQDHYGFFNGQDNNTLIPVPGTLTWQQKMPLATANRNVNPVYCQKGLLSTIVYPTGGKDSILYEANQVNQPVTTYPSQTSVNAYAYHEHYTGGSGTTTYSSNAVISYQHEVTLVGQCRNGEGEGSDPIHDQSNVSVLDENNTVYFTRTLHPGDNLNEVFELAGGHTYRVKVTSIGENVEGNAVLTFRPGNTSTTNSNVNAGGVRVAKVITSDGTTYTTSIKKYLYSSLANPAVSSGGKMYSPVYEKFLIIEIPCQSGQPLLPGEPATITNCDMTEFGFYSMYSNTLNNIYIYPSAPVSYRYVTESFGEDFNNGGIEHQYTLHEDQDAYQIAGDGLLLSAPLTSYAWKNAREIYQHVFKTDGGSGYLPVKKVFTHFKEDSRVDEDIKAYVVNKKYTPYCQSNPPSDMELDAYDLLSFSHFRKWVYPDTVRTWTYDLAGLNYLEQINVTEYANVAHALPTKQITNSSDQGTKSVTIAYPQDVTLSGDEETARQALVTKHMIGSVLQQKVFKNATQLYNMKTAYHIFSGDLVLPQTNSVQVKANSIEERTKFYDYNSYGKILEQSKTDDVRQSYIWSNSGIYPLAQVINASTASAAYTSFEIEGSGGWTFSGTPVADATSPTGKRAYAPSSNITKSVAAGTYIVSYWNKVANGNSQSVNGTSGTAGGTINGWTLYEHKVVLSSAGTITVSGSGTIDELRLYPEKAQMVSSTYEPLVGITSQCDVNNNITYYEYDALGRVKYVKDKERYIIKSFDYKYYTDSN